MSSPSSMALCPINFTEFNKLNVKLNNIDACLLFSKIKFHERYTKIKKSGDLYIARSRTEIAQWFDFSVKKVDRLLSILEQANFIKKHTGMWYGKKKLFITTTDTDNDNIPVNFELLKNLIQQSGSLNAALIFSRIAFALANSKIRHKNLTWCCLKKEHLVSWSGFCLRTIDTIIAALIKKGLLLKKILTWKGRSQSHFHIPSFIINLFKTLHEKWLKQPNTGHAQNPSNLINTQNCRSQPAKPAISISKRTKEKEINNSRVTIETKPTNKKSDITFNTITQQLTPRQMKYLKGAFSNTCSRYRVTLSNPKDIFEQLKFSILNTEQRKGVSLFKHAVSRCMKILGDGNWRVPIGFYNHSAKGRAMKTSNQERLDTWEKQKQEEIDSHQSDSQSPIKKLLGLNIRPHIPNDCLLTKEALALVEQYLRMGEMVDSSSKTHYIEYMNNLVTKIYELIQKGANKEKIMSQFV